MTDGPPARVSAGEWQMTDKRVLWIVAGVVIGAAAVWVQNWWTLAAMVILVAGQLVALLRARAAERSGPDAGADRDASDPAGD